MCIGHTSEVYIWLSNKLLCKIYIRDTLNYLNLRCNTAKLLWVVIYVVCYGWFPPDLVVMNICRQRLIKVDRPLWQRSLANENAVVCRQGAMRWRLYLDRIIYMTQLIWPLCYGWVYWMPSLKGVGEVMVISLWAVFLFSSLWTLIFMFLL